MRRTDFLPLAHQAPTDVAGLPGFLAVLKSGSLETDHPAAFAGIVNALYVKFPEAEVWTGEDAEILAAAHNLYTTTPVTSAMWNIFHLAGWAVTGSLVDLAELVRAVLNRDGSADALHVGTAAISLLAEALEADPVLAAELKACNFSLGSFKVGSYPTPGSVKLPLVVASKTAVGRPNNPAGGSMVPSLPVATLPTVTKAVSSVAPVRASAISPLGIGTVRVPGAAAVVADEKAGRVMLDIGAFPLTALTITDAVKLGTSLTVAAGNLIRPAEGFQWVDDTVDPQYHSMLVELDGVRGKGLPAPPVPSGALMQAQVVQVPSAGPDPNAGKYTARIYNRTGGFDEFATGADDMNDAKFAVAERVRHILTP